MCNISLTESRISTNYFIEYQIRDPPSSPSKYIVKLTIQNDHHMFGPLYPAFEFEIIVLDPLFRLQLNVLDPHFFRIKILTTVFK